ncbi:MAG: porin [Rhodocyclaceae bacterium]|nr:MAG: porin [Rhodocyclaceae bacterium]
MKKSQLAQSIAIALLAGAAAGSAQAVSFSQNDVNVDINGTVNGFFVNRQEDWTNNATGAKASTSNSGISNGLLPGWINFVATTTVDGTDVKAHISFAPGINNNSSVVGLPIGNNANGAGITNPYSQIDTRNLYLQFGNKDWGTIKVGRDIGLFAQEVIFSDMTLIGVGGTTNASIPYNTTFGMIGHGYMYTGFQAQATYTTPNKDGLEGSVGLFQPAKFSGNETKTPGLQAKASYDWKGSAPGKAWVGYVSQSTNCNASAAAFAAVGACNGVGYRANGEEAGIKATFDKLGLVGYTFRGKGLGLSTIGAQFLGGANASGALLDSSGYFLQGTYQATAKTKLGLNYGRNEDKDGWLTNNGKKITNNSYTIGVYHAFNKFLNLVGEFNTEDVKNVADSNVNLKTRSVSLGAVVFF